MSKLWLSPRFSREVDKHIFMNDWYHDRRIPLMLIIQGPKGTGKTTQLRVALKQNGVDWTEVPASRMAGDESVATQVLIEAYGSASSLIDNGKRSALLIDDLDMSILSRKDNTNYSQNTQLLSVTFMALCDNPKSAVGARVHRVPIFATVNEVTGFHSPLVRAGRARLWNWNPSEAERLQIIAVKFPFLQPSDHRAIDRELVRIEGFGMLDEILNEILFSIHEADPQLRRARYDAAVVEADRRLATAKGSDVLRVGRMILAERKIQSQL